MADATRGVNVDAGMPGPKTIVAAGDRAQVHYSANDGKGSTVGASDPLVATGSQSR